MGTSIVTSTQYKTSLYNSHTVWAKSVETFEIMPTEPYVGSFRICDHFKTPIWFNLAEIVMKNLQKKTRPKYWRLPGRLRVSGIN